LQKGEQPTDETLNIVGMHMVSLGRLLDILCELFEEESKAHAKPMYKVAIVAGCLVGEVSAEDLVALAHQFQQVLIQGQLSNRIFTD